VTEGVLVKETRVWRARQYMREARHLKKGDGGLVGVDEDGVQPLAHELGFEPVHQPRAEALHLLRLVDGEEDELRKRLGHERWRGDDGGARSRARARGRRRLEHRRVRPVDCAGDELAV
jgi:hypothetical protein